MSGGTGGYSAAKTTSLEYVNVRAANAHLLVRGLGGEAAGAHVAVLAASPLVADGTGLHVVGTVERGGYAVLPALRKHFCSGLTDRDVLNFTQFCHIL